MTFVPIWIGGHHLEVSVETLQSLCPGLYQEFWNSTGDDLVRQVHNTLNGLTNPRIKQTTVEKVLVRVFQHMQQTTWSFGHSSPEKLVRKIVEDRLDDELGHHSVYGLRQSRQSYLIICAFAKIASSQPLAEQMSKLLTNQGWKIETYEQHHYIKEWSLGLRALQELSLEQNTLGPNLFNTWPPTPPLLPLMLAPHHNPFDTYHRGRAPLLLTPPHYPRTRSLGHRRSHGLQLALPRLSNSAWTSPAMSPALRTPGTYLDEVGQLQWQQEEMNWKLDGIDQKLDRLVAW